MQGESPQAFTLWNEVSKGVFQPKEEDRLSDRVKTHLEKDLRALGLVASREVEIRRGFGVGKGEITDIHVHVLGGKGTDRARDPICVIIETKGSWHGELWTAMETQLVDRYLQDNAQCRGGLYLVGWYDCPQWDGNHRTWKDRRNKDMSIVQARARLDEQAASLTREERSIRALVINVGLR